MLPRIIPSIIVEEGRAIHTRGFKYSSYLGDPLNLARLYSELDSDELLILDRTQNFDETLLGKGAIRKLSEQVFTPLSYGGAITDKEQVALAFDSGLDKIVLKIGARNALAVMDWTASKFGSQSIIACINFFEDEALAHQQNVAKMNDLPRILKSLENVGAGEILVQNVARAGSMSGFGESLSALSPKAIRQPIIIGGGVGSTADIKHALGVGFSGVAVSTLFCLERRSQAPLTSYLTQAERQCLEAFTS